jgi:hypothetical protein
MSKHLVFPQPIAHSPTKLESRSAPQRFRRRLDRWPSGGPWRLATPPAAPAATALDRGRSPPTRAVHGAPVRCRTDARTAHSGRRAIARRREKKTYTVIIPVVRQNTTHSPQSPPSRQIRNFLQGVPCQKRHPDKEACHRSAPCPRLARAPHVASTTSARGRARCASRPAVHRTSQAASAPLRKSVEGWCPLSERLSS